MVQILLAAGADPTAQDAQHGRTALHTAAMANDVELVKVWEMRRTLFTFALSTYLSLAFYFFIYQTFKLYDTMNL